MATAREELREAFLHWLTLTDGQRVALGQPKTEREWGEQRGVTDRTLRRWKEEPAFAAKLSGARSTAAATLAPSAVLTTDAAAAALVGLSAPAEGADVHEVLLATTFAKLADLIAANDKGAMQLFLSSPVAKAYMEAQLENRKSDWRSVTDEQLAARTLALLPDEVLAAALEARGWACSPAEPAEPAEDGL